MWQGTAAKVWIRLDEANNANRWNMGVVDELYLQGAVGSQTGVVATAYPLAVVEASETSVGYNDRCGLRVEVKANDHA